MKPIGIGDIKDPHRIKRNLYLLTFALMLKFTAYKGLASLQSSLHTQSGLGTVGQGLVSFSSLFSNLLLPGYCTAKVGQKYTIVLGSVGYVLWMVANAFPAWLTLAPTSVLVGFCAGPVWIAVNSYISKLATTYAHLLNEPIDIIITNFFGTFWGIFHCSRVFGALISSTILSDGKSKHPALDVSHCGASNCPWNMTSKEDSKGPSEVILWTLVGTYISLAVTGFLLLLCFLDDIREDPVHSRPASHIIYRTLNIFSKPAVILMLPFLFGFGCYKAFFVADWTRSYITCAIGMHYIGVCSIFQGGFRSLTSYLAGVLNKWFGRVPILINTVFLELGLLVFLLMWLPDPNGGYLYFLVSSIHGGAMGLTTPNLNALTTLLFPDQVTAAFAAFSMVDIVGHTAGYAYSSALCTHSKIYILLAILVVGMFGYVHVEWYERQKQATRVVEIENVTLIDTETVG